MGLNKKSVDDINVKGQRVLVRCDFNVPLQDGKITDENRLVAALPTIKKLIADGGKIILCSHLGKPKGEPKPELSLAPVAKRLTELLGQEVKFVPSPVVVDDTVKAAVADMKDGEIKYSMFCNDNGGIIDDFIVYRCAADNYWLVVNAGNRGVARDADSVSVTIPVGAFIPGGPGVPPVPATPLEVTGSITSASTIVRIP